MDELVVNNFVITIAASGHSHDNKKTRTQVSLFVYVAMKDN